MAKASAQIKAFDGMDKWEIAWMLFPYTPRFEQFVKECDRAGFIDWALSIWNRGSIKAGLMEAGLSYVFGAYEPVRHTKFELASGADPNEKRLNLWLEMVDDAVMFPSCDI